MRKTWLFGVAFTFLVGGFLFNFSVDTMANTNIKTPKEMMNVDQPGYHIKANEPNAKLLSREEIESQTNPRQGAQHVLSTLLPWEEALGKYDPYVRDYRIDPTRKTWVIQYYYPDGYQTKRGYMKNCLVTGFYDAETGQIRGARYQSLKPGEVPQINN
jgi:hypothetical protein